MIRTLTGYRNEYDEHYFVTSNGRTICCYDKLLELYPAIDGAKRVDFNLHASQEPGTLPIRFREGRFLIKDIEEPMFNVVYETVLDLGDRLYYLEVVKDE